VPRKEIQQKLIASLRQKRGLNCSSHFSETTWVRFLALTKFLTLLYYKQITNSRDLVFYKKSNMFVNSMHGLE